MTWDLIWGIARYGGVAVIGAFLWHITFFEERVNEAREDGISVGMKL